MTSQTFIVPILQQGGPQNTNHLEQSMNEGEALFIEVHIDLFVPQWLTVRYQEGLKTRNLSWISIPKMSFTINLH